MPFHSTDKTCHYEISKLHTFCSCHLDNDSPTIILQAVANPKIGATSSARTIFYVVDIARIVDVSRKNGIYYVSELQKEKY
jgi:hypothetical protein